MACSRLQQHYTCITCDLVQDGAPRLERDGGRHVPSLSLPSKNLQTRGVPQHELRLHALPWRAQLCCDLQASSPPKADRSQSLGVLRNHEDARRGAI